MKDKLFPDKTATIRAPVPEPNPLTITILTGSECDSFLVQLFSNPQHMQAMIASSEYIEKANEDMIELAKTTDIEGSIESLVKAKGFSDCMVYIGDDAVNVVVASSGLDAEQAAQINEIVISESGREASKIKIVEIKAE